MRKWVENAGMVYTGSKYIHDHLIIAYEPDCASIALQIELNAKVEEKSEEFNAVLTKGTFFFFSFHRFPRHRFKNKTGDKYMVLDLGGGTADIAIHEVVGEAKVKEIAPPSGGP